MKTFFRFVPDMERQILDCSARTPSETSSSNRSAADVVISGVRAGCAQPLPAQEGEDAAEAAQLSWKSHIAEDCSSPSDKGLALVRTLSTDIAAHRCGIGDVAADFGKIHLTADQCCRKASA